MDHVGCPQSFNSDTSKLSCDKTGRGRSCWKLQLEELQLEELPLEVADEVHNPIGGFRATPRRADLSKLPVRRPDILSPGQG